MKFVSFNVNGIRARLDQLRTIIERHAPDVMGLQETKVEDDLFPIEDIQSLGYQSTFHGQKGHYGVALLYRQAPSVAGCGFPADDDDDQRRLVRITLETRSGPLHVYNGYFPQGENREHPLKFAAKEAFYRNLLEHLSSNHSPQDQIVVMGDMNVAPLDKDIGIGENNRKRWLREGKCCFLPEERQWLGKLMEWGLTDTYEHQNSAEGEDRYSWFDYRSKGFEQTPKRGLRIDLILATQPLLMRQTAAGIDQSVRGMVKPSDHCPAWVEFELEE